MDLFTPVVSEDAQHANFRTIAKFANAYNEDVLNEWARGFKDRDGKFVKEFQTTFDSSFWELYLFAVMKHFHLDVDFSFNAPDFVIANHGGMSVEATVASHAQGSTPESVKPGAPIPDDLNEFNRQTIIRISNSLAAKRRKYIESYAGLAHVQNRPFVVALSASDRPFAMLTCLWRIVISPSQMACNIVTSLFFMLLISKALLVLTRHRANFLRAIRLLLRPLREHAASFAACLGQTSSRL